MFNNTLCNNPDSYTGSQTLFHLGICWWIYVKWFSTGFASVFSFYIGQNKWWQWSSDLFLLGSIEFDWTQRLWRQQQQKKNEAVLLPDKPIFWFYLCTIIWLWLYAFHYLHLALFFPDVHNPVREAYDPFFGVTTDQPRSPASDSENWKQNGNFLEWFLWIFLTQNGLKIK